MTDIFSAATAQRDALLVGVSARMEELAQWVNTIPVPAPAVCCVPNVDSGPRTGGGGPLSTDQGGDCYAQPYIPAGIVSRESGGDPTIINGGGHAASPYESGGRSWGCFQFMPGTWAANCADLGFDVAGQIECARRVSSDGTNLNPWRL